MNSTQDDTQSQPQSHTSIQHLVDDHEERKQQQQPSNPVSFPKEAGPPRMTIEAPSMPEIAENNQEQNETTPFIQEVDDQKKMKLSADLKKAGLKFTDDANIPSGFQNIKLPISDEKVLNGQKAPITSSMRWLAEFCLFMLKQAHVGLKVVHGHVVRVIRRD